MIHPFNKTFYLILKGFFASLRMTLAFYNLQGGEKEGGLRPPSFSLSPDHKALCHSDAQRGISFHWINLTLVCVARNLFYHCKTDFLHSSSLHTGINFSRNNSFRLRAMGMQILSFITAAGAFSMICSTYSRFTR